MKNRRSDRRGSSLLAEVYTRTDVIAASTENVSDCGICLQVDARLQEDELVGVSLYPVDDGIEDPDAEPMNVPAKVVWCGHRSGTGILAGMRLLDED